MLVYGYANGVFSSRKIERATYDSVAFRFIAAGTHPDHDTLATFRRRFLDELAGLFVQVLEMAREMKLLKLGTISLDGTKVKANASRHSALSHGHIEQLETPLKAEVDSLLAQAEQADQSAVPDGMNLPAAITRRQARPRSRNVPKPVSRKSKPSTKVSWRVAKPRRRKAARNPAASRRNHRLPDRRRKTSSI